MKAFLEKTVTLIEAFFSWRKRRRWEKKEKQKRKHFLIDWLDALVWAALVVLLVNQYFFQAYAIPTGSMKATLMEQDRIFVNKMIFGPEILPGVGKLPGFEIPKRGDIVIFENPLYETKGPFFDIAQKFLYMVTLSMVDIDAGSFHYLIKRQVGDDGDWLRLRRGELEIRAQGESDFIKERDFIKISGLNYQIRRLHNSEYYDFLEQATRAVAFSETNLEPLTEDLEAFSNLKKIMAREDLPLTQKALESLTKVKMDERGSPEVIPADEDETIRLISQYKYQISPYSQDILNNFHKYIYHKRAENSSKATLSHLSSEVGLFIPKGWLLPLGDNRDNSRDGRVWGIIQKEKALGKAAFRFWPLGQFGEIQ